ncbi:NAD(P)-dependent oxidoreductase [Pelagibacterium montanilacus]|uniref:NAD(P)-dependent oxidoreductase n=1 Tax=Pelagibacterium montanilacus TaxID=2185280 RepID=UPI000F8E4DDE|nr:NAD(P)-dependent oxidoreductase [Pelagibacterium montanilacus]
MKIAFLGTGLMGAPMARNLAGRFDVKVWNRSADKAQALADVASVAASPAQAAAGADVVVMMMFDATANRAVLEEGGVLEALASGATIIDMASVEPASDIEMAGMARARGLRYLDAPVSGGTVGAEQATLSIFVGGEAEDAEAMRPVFEAMGRPSHMGPVGTGQVAKLANQLIVATTVGAVAEAFHLARECGCDIGTLRNALRGGFADSRILDLHGQRMVEGNFVPGGKSSAQLKDLRNVMSAAREAGADLPLAETVTDAFTDFVDNHEGADIDHAGYYLWLDKRAATKGKGKP